jgi:hypothetical protein
MGLIGRVSNLPLGARIGGVVGLGLTIFPCGAFLAYAGLAVGGSLAEWGQSTRIFGMAVLAPAAGLILYAAAVLAIPILSFGLLGWSLQRSVRLFVRAS